MVATRVMCKNNKHLNKTVEEIIDNGGEGIMLRKIGSKYEHGRSNNLLKIKTSLVDAEGVVVAVNNGDVEMKLPNGQSLTVSKENNQLTALPKIGEVVTYTYEKNIRRDSPVNARIVRIRNDLSWNEVVKNFRRDTINESVVTVRPPGYWTESTMRNFLIEFASSKNLEPLSPDSWYNSLESFYQSKGARTILNKYKGNYLQMLQSLFPEITFDPGSFHRSSWSDIGNRRNFFQNFAKIKDFDAEVADNWYSQSRKEIMSQKGATGVIAHHNFSVSQALLDLFPNIGLDKEKVQYMWHDASMRRNFFEKYAKERGFDPLLGENWCIQSRKEILSIPGAKRILKHHNYSLNQALVDLFPETGLTIQKLQERQGGWLLKIMENRRKVFKLFAKKYGFSPHVPENWYSVPKYKFLNFKGGPEILVHYENSLSMALLNLFPNIGLDESKFKFKTRNEQIKREFFMKYAQDKNFDPLNPENWYSQSKKDILSAKGVKEAIGTVRTVSQAILDSFPNVSFNKIKLKACYSIWRDPKNRIKFFEKFAESTGFNLYNSHNWYNITRQQILAVKGGLLVLYFHDNLVSKALMDLFPNIKFNKSKFKVSTMWHYETDRRNFFIDFACNNKFDPFDPNCWYNQLKEKIIAQKGGSTVLYYHSNNIADALLDLFPNIGLDESRFLIPSLWGNIDNRRQFFLSFAEKNGFECSNLDSWKKHKTKIMASRGISSILRYHKGSVVQAVQDLFKKGIS